MSISTLGSKLSNPEFVSSIVILYSELTFNTEFASFVRVSLTDSRRAVIMVLKELI